VLSRTLCPFLAKEEERDASAYHALSTGGSFTALRPSVGEVRGVSEKMGETGETGETGEIGDSSLCGLGVEDVSRRALNALQLIGGREREVNASLIFRQKVTRRRGDLGS